MFTVHEPDVTRAWIAACNALDRRDNPSRTALHTVVRIADATRDDPDFRRDLDGLRATSNSAKKTYAPLETVANTIFPAALASRCASPSELVERYRTMFPVIKRYPGNHYGTYFGRLVAYPGPSGPIDQLSRTITRLREQDRTAGPMTAAYEVDIAHPLDGECDADDCPPTANTSIHTADRDTLYRGFPCLSHCSFQRDRAGRVHLVALYRSHHMYDRAYGNYLGLGRLTAYIAHHAGLRLGSLTVVAGHAHLDGPISRVRTLLTGTPTLVA